MLTSRELGFTPTLPNSTNLTSHLLHGPRPSLLPSHPPAHIPLQHSHLLSFRSEPGHQMIQPLNYRPEVPETENRPEEQSVSAPEQRLQELKFLVPKHPFYKITETLSPGLQTDQVTGLTSASLHYESIKGQLNKTSTHQQ